LSGPAIGRAVDADSLSVLDVALTVAAIPDRPVTPLWTGRPAVASNEEQTTQLYALPRSYAKEPGQIDERLRDQLSTLGYLE
jgi:hypothetical protein